LFVRVEPVGNDVPESRFAQMPIAILEPSSLLRFIRAGLFAQPVYRVCHRRIVTVAVKAVCAILTTQEPAVEGSL
jgi:hypothetical protein